MSQEIKKKLFLLLIVSGLAVYAGQSFEESLRKFIPEPYPFRSVFNEKPTGLSALLSIAKRSGLTSQTWLSPYRRLAKQHGVLCIVEPRQTLVESEIKTILHWVAEGNQLIYYDYFPNRKLLSALGVRLLENHKNKPVPASECRLEKTEVLYIDHNALEMQHVKNLQIKSRTKLIGGRTLVGREGGSYVTSINYGNGRVLLGTVPNICANGKLRLSTNYDNFQFMINCLRTAGGVILFDEYCHGVTKSNGLFSYLAGKLPALIFAQLVLMLTIAIVSSRIRFGPIKTIRTSRQISDLAYVSGVAGVYQRAQANTAALEIIIQSWKNRLCRYLNLSPRLDNAEIIRWATDEKISSTWVNNLTQLLANYKISLESGDITKNQLIELIKECDTLERDIRKDKNND